MIGPCSEDFVQISSYGFPEWHTEGPAVATAVTHLRPRKLPVSCREVREPSCCAEKPSPFSGPIRRDCLVGLNPPQSTTPSVTLLLSDLGVPNLCCKAGPSTPNSVFRVPKQDQNLNRGLGIDLINLRQGMVPPTTDLSLLQYGIFSLIV